MMNFPMNLRVQGYNELINTAQLVQAPVHKLAFAIFVLIEGLVNNQAQLPMEYLKQMQQNYSQVADTLPTCNLLANAVSAAAMTLCSVVWAPNLLQQACTSRSRSWLPCKVGATGAYAVGCIALVAQLWLSVQAAISAQHGQRQGGRLGMFAPKPNPSVLSICATALLPGILVVPGVWLTNGSVVTWLLLRVTWVAAVMWAQQASDNANAKNMLASKSPIQLPKQAAASEWAMALMTLLVLPVAEGAIPYLASSVHVLWVGALLVAVAALLCLQPHQLPAAIQPQQAKLKAWLSRK